MKYSGIGGQAVIEGIMMMNRNDYAVAVRRPDGEIEIKKDKYESITTKAKILSLPFIRGVFRFADSMILGMKTLTYSASFFEDDEEEEPGRFEKFLDRVFGEKLESVIMSIVMVLSFILAIGIFMILPLVIASFFKSFITSEHVMAVLEGVIRIAIFIAYIKLVSRMEDIRRTFMYHGAEHKCINCIENGHILTVNNVRKSSRFHKRCGTSFLLIVLVISIIFFMIIRTDVVWLRYFLRILMVPVIAGVSYEFIRKAGTSDNKIINALSMPGLWMQKITTKEPTDDMIEVAIEAVEAVFDWEQYLIDNGIAARRPKKVRKQVSKENIADIDPDVDRVLNKSIDNALKRTYVDNSVNPERDNIGDNDFETYNQGVNNQQEEKKVKTGSGYNWKF